MENRNMNRNTTYRVLGLLLLVALMLQGNQVMAQEKFSECMETKRSWSFYVWKYVALEYGN